MESGYSFTKHLKEILETPIKKGEDVFIADTARVFGKVSLGNNCSVWFGAVLRGDADEITIGNKTNIQENAVVHVDPGYPVSMGDECIIGHGAIVHGAKMGNNVLVGMHATILNGAQIGNYCIIGAHALVTEGMVIPDNSIVMGAPAKVVKQLSQVHIDKVKRNALVYAELGKAYLELWK
ncbi:MAG: gamma carbonic anhydrase family protein [Bacteroidetes bacterium B1(2017)]|nr:MAG: gamma carbonic anhydrase family protein [Bacteroidetes bacterium B1(2017)]